MCEIQLIGVDGIMWLRPQDVCGQFMNHRLSEVSQSHRRPLPTETKCGELRFQKALRPTSPGTKENIKRMSSPWT